MKITPELMAKAKEAKSAEELLAFAKENGVELTAEEAEQYFEQLHATGELADDELENVSGGGCGGGGNKEEERNYYVVGDHIRFYFFYHDLGKKVIYEGDVVEVKNYSVVVEYYYDCHQFPREVEVHVSDIICRVKGY